MWNLYIFSTRTQGLPLTTWWCYRLGWRWWQAYRFYDDDEEWECDHWNMKQCLWQDDDDDKHTDLWWWQWQRHWWWWIRKWLVKHEVIMMISSTGKFRWAKGSALSSFGSFSETTACLAFRSFFPQSLYSPSILIAAKIQYTICLTIIKHLLNTCKANS